MDGTSILTYDFLVPSSPHACCCCSKAGSRHEGLLPQQEPNLGYEALIRWAGTGVYVCMCDEEVGRDSTNTTAIHHF